MYKKAIQQIQLRRERDVSFAKDLFEDALNRYPELFALEKELRSSILDDAKDNKKASQKTLKLTRSRDDFLAKAGLTKKELEPPFRCKFCFDTGLIEKNVCDCAKVFALNAEVNIGIPLYNFKDFSPSLFEKENKDKNVKIFHGVEKIMNSYPNTSKRVILIHGPPGTGKTFLAGCSATAILEKNFSVVAITAFEFVNRARLYHTTFDDDKSDYLDALLDANLLIIDDLGTEPILNNITREYLFLILNERGRGGLLTLINTNLNPSDVTNRYGDRVASRLMDKNSCSVAKLDGNDIRFKKR